MDCRASRLVEERGNGGGALRIAEDGEDDGFGLAGEHGFLAMEQGVSKGGGSAFGKGEGGIGGRDWLRGHA